MLFRKSGLLCLSFCCFFSQAFTQANLIEKITKIGDELVIPYEKYLLGNGLTLIIHEDHSDPVVHVDVTYHVGSAREQIGKSGFAHFFEHMMFMGSENAPEKLHDNITIGNGGSNNGSTNRDRTNYYETIPKNALEPVLWLEADRMGFLLNSVTQPKFEVQRATVKNERGQSVDNSPYGLVYETINKNLYPYGHPYSWETIGYLEDLDRSNVDDLKNFFLRWYNPNNATLTIGGDVKAAEVVKLVEKYFGSIPRGPEVIPVQVEPVRLTANRYVAYTDNYARLPMLGIVFPTVPDYHKDMAALDALAEILGRGKTSVLYQQLVKKQLALQASASSNLSELAGEFSFRFLPGPGKSIADMEQLFRNALDSFEQRGVTDEDLTKFKGQIESQMVNRLQSVAGKVSQLAEFQTFTGNPNKIASLLQEYNAVTKEDVMRVYNTYIKNKGAVILSTTIKTQPDAVAKQTNFRIDSSHYTAPDYGYAGLVYAKHNDVFDRTKAPAAGPVPVVKAPKIWKKALPYGAKLAGAENNEIPLVMLTLSFAGGHLADAGDLSKAGRSYLFSLMMNEDTRNYTTEQLTTELDKLGSTLSVLSERDRVSFTIRSLKKSLDKTLALLQERLFNPLFKQETFDRIKNQTLEGFKLQKARPVSVASNVFPKLNYGADNILGIDAGGTEETVRNITLDDVRSYKANYMSSQGAMVIVTGDIKEEELLPKLAFLSKLPNNKVTRLAPKAPQGVDKTKIYLVNVPKAAQTEFRIGYATGLKYDATGDYYKATLTNYPLGEGFTSRFNQYLRETKGWTYGARSGFSGNAYSGEFQFSSGIRANATDSALHDVMQEFTRYTSTGPTQNEVDFMKKAMAQREALSYESLFQKASFIRRLLDYNLPDNFMVKQAEILQKMDAAGMKAIAAKWMNPQKLNILLVADKDRILPGIKKFGYDIVELNADGNAVEKKAF
ncbi:MAG: insulinase family protein [Williamsia sp.]|nr:insulinase family protein [Williamsia sp.]